MNSLKAVQHIPTFPWCKVTPPPYYLLLNDRLHSHRKKRIDSSSVNQESANVLNNFFGWKSSLDSLSLTFDEKPRWMQQTFPYLQWKFSNIFGTSLLRTAIDDRIKDIPSGARRCLEWLLEEVGGGESASTLSNNESNRIHPALLKLFVDAAASSPSQKVQLKLYPSHPAASSPTHHHQPFIHDIRFTYASSLAPHLSSPSSTYPLFFLHHSTLDERVEASEVEGGPVEFIFQVDVVLPQCSIEMTHSLDNSSAPLVVQQMRDVVLTLESNIFPVKIGPYSFQSPSGAASLNWKIADLDYLVLIHSLYSK